MAPHPPDERSATIEVMAGDETILDGGRFATDAAANRAMLGCARLDDRHMGCPASRRRL